MSAILTVDIEKHFNGSSPQKVEMESNGQIPIGTRPQSYQCSREVFSFDQDKPYHMTMEIRNIHVQAYDVEGGYSTGKAHLFSTKLISYVHLRT